GGVGLFLFGMQLMTEALREGAGPGLRTLLARFTTTPLRGALTGAGITALIQSSSATSVMTVGFVGAGLITMPQALGVLYGANVGTTVTGWIVAFLGVKLQIGTLAQPVLFLAALALVLVNGQWVGIARGVAGACLLFIGLDLMQSGAALAEGWITPEGLPGDTFAGRLVLVGLGALLVAVVQSSSAGMAIALVLLAGGAISFAQAASLAIGLNIGSTVTGLLAALGGGRATRQTAYANTLFNLGTAALAFPLLSLLSPVLHATPLGDDDVSALVLFHTAFNLVGTLVFLPLTPRFAALLDRIVRPEPEPFTATLDPALRADPPSALAAAEASAGAMHSALFDAMGRALAPEPDLRLLSSVPARVFDGLDRLEEFLAPLRLPEGQQDLQDRVTALLHRMDHLQRLATRAQTRGPLAVIARDRRLARAAWALGGRLRAGSGAVPLARLARQIDRRTQIYRRQTLRLQTAGSPVQDLFDRTDAMRWLAHIADHAASITRYAPD
ncbi:MAG: Na/Pi cotransporter family protein, partial [Pararhodobacter sp.]